MNKAKYLGIAAVTIDGKIAKDSNHLSTEWTSAEDKTFFRKLLKECDVVLIGNNTYQTAKEPLSKRNCIVLTRSVDEMKKENDHLVFINAEKTDLGKYVEDKGYQKVGVLGGSQVYTFCLENNLLDEIYLTIEPTIFGQGIDLFTNAKPLDKTFHLNTMEKLNEQGTILLHYIK